MKYYASRLTENISKTPEGFLLCIGVPIARTGDQEYIEGETPLEVGSNGKVIISRSEKEVFRPETIASFEGKAFTIQHPQDFVNPNNWSFLAKGHVQNVRRGDGATKDDLIADILITDSRAISLVNEGMRGLSCGYEAEYTQTGEGKGEQTNIVGNHVALVEEGRAGDKYKIKDHKGDHMTKLEKLLAKLGLTKDSVMAKAIDEAMKEDEGKPAKDEEMGMYDELVKVVKDLGAKVDAMKPKDADPAPEKNDKEEPAKDEPVEGALEERLKKLEEAVAKLLEAKSTGDEDEDESEDADLEEGEESGDEDFSVTGDTASRAEILAPGIGKVKDIKVQALKAAYKTEEGQKVINSLTGGKPTFDSAEKVDTLFIAASELLKVSRSGKLSKTKTTDYTSAIFEKEGVMTADKMNEMNAKRYGLNK